MKKTIALFIFIITISSSVFSQGGVLVLEGVYQGKDPAVLNPNGASGVGFCVTEVLVNGNITTDETNQSSFEIDLKSHKLKIGDKVEIKIKHKEGCKPRIINPEIFKPKSSFDVVSLTIDKEGLVKWTTKNESGKLDFIIEQNRWGGVWVPVGQVTGEGTPENHSYSFKVALHSGKNVIRIRQTDYTGVARTSKNIDVMSTVPEVKFGPAKVSKEINFVTVKDEKPSETMYRICDAYGINVKAGYGSKVDLSNLTKGLYYIQYDNKIDEFVKK